MMNDGRLGPVFVGDWVSVHYTAIPSGKQIVFDGQVIAIREPVDGQRSIRVEPIIPAYKAQWWHRWQVESYRIEGAGAPVCTTEIVS